MVNSNQVMKLSVFLSIGLLFTPMASYANSVNYYDQCYRNIEEYIPGYYTSEGHYVGGYVKSERKVVPCGNVPSSTFVQGNEYSAPKCRRNRTRFGGLLGGAVAAAVSKKDAYLWSIPVGVVLGVGAARANCD